MIVAGPRNLPLTRCVFHQARLTPEEYMKFLKKFVPKSEGKDWELPHAGMRAQIIKKDPDKGRRD